MSTRHVSHVMSTAGDLTPAERLVLLTLAWFAGAADGAVSMSVGEIAERTGYSRRNVHYILDSLLSRGALIRTSVGTQKLSLQVTLPEAPTSAMVAQATSAMVALVDPQTSAMVALAEAPETPPNMCNGCTSTSAMVALVDLPPLTNPPPVPTARTTATPSDEGSLARVPAHTGASAHTPAREAETAPPEPPPMVFAAKGGDWTLTPEARAQLETDFPALNGRLASELRNAQAWLDANPSRRKTPRGMPLFLRNWLSRASQPPPWQRPASPGAQSARDAIRTVDPNNPLPF